MKTETENNGPSAEDAESLMETVGYLALDPALNAPHQAITSYEPKVSPVAFKDIFDLLHNGCWVAVDHEVAEEVKRRFKKLDPTNTWDLDEFPASENTVELCLGERSDAIAIRLGRGPVPSEQEIRELVDAVED